MWFPIKREEPNPMWSADTLRLLGVMQRGWESTWAEGYWWIHSTASTLSVTWFCGGWSLWGSNQGCRLFLGYIQSNWKDEKWHSHKSPQSRAADSEHIITCVPGECAVRWLSADRASAVASSEPARLTGKPIVVYTEYMKRKKCDRRPLPRLSAWFFVHQGENGVWAYSSGNVKSVANWLTQPN